MPSPVIDKVTEFVTESFGNFQPERVVPDIEDFLASLHEVPQALADAVKKVAARLEDDYPLNMAVAEALREIVPSFETAAERAKEANEIFRTKHEQEIDQHHNPRSSEKAWNTEA
jgi:hypothetical protein